MNFKRIFLFDRNKNSFIDKTGKVKEISFDSQKRKWFVDFGGGWSYFYDKDNVRIIDTDNVVTDADGRNVMMTPSVVSSREKMTLSYLVTYCLHQVDIQSMEQQTSANQKKQDRSEVRNFDDDDETVSTDATCPFQYIGNALGKVVLLGNILPDYLRGTTIEKKREAMDNTVIFPFGCNRSQYLAVTRALENPLSVIEGPPGTGKTQTILNLIANLLIRGKSIAVVSNNNSAVDNVKEKLEEKKLAWLVASLGNNDNVKKFFEKDLPEVTVLPEWKLEKEYIPAMQKRISILSNEVNMVFERQLRRESLSLRLRETEHEHKVFLAQHECDKNVIESTAALFDDRKEKRLDILEARFLSYVNSRKLMHFWRKFRLRLILGRHFDALIADRDIFLWAIALARYKASIKNLKKEIESLQDTADIKEKLDEFRNISRKLLHNWIHRSFADKTFPEFNASTYKSSGDFCKRFPIVTSSTYSLYRCAPGTFDYVIVDEASQVNLPTGALCMSLARNMVIVGDRRQLTHIADERSLHPCRGIDAAYDALDESLLSSVLKVFDDRIPNTLLVEHYRCHPLIIGFCNKRFYDGRIVVMTHSDAKFPFRIVDVPTGPLNRDPNGSPVNFRQIEETHTVIEQCLKMSVQPSEIGVISPYRGHADALGKGLHEEIEADTVHKFQGREKDVIIYNSVQNRVTAFNDNANLVNVAVSRARKGMVLVVPKKAVLASEDSNLSALVRFIDYNDLDGHYTRTSSFSSVFDHLYTENWNYDTKKGESPAEALFRKMLDEVLSSYNGLSYIQEYYLINLVRDRSMFSSEEWRFMSNGSRLDFLIYDTMNNEARLVVEVDGSTHNTSAQQRRDTLKDNILSKLKIRHLRFRTDNVRGGERKILEDTLAVYLNALPS